MQFSGETNNQDLYSDARYLCGIASTDTTTYPIEDFTRNANIGFDRVVALIMQSDNVWEWDDTNNTDLPIGTASLVASQQDYAISVAHLKILKVRIKDQQGNWVSLDPINRRELSDSQLTATAGDPKRYDKIGNSIFLYPKPSYASTSGLEVQFQRGASYFAVTDTTKSPGFATQFHRLISLYGAEEYADQNDMDKKLAKIRDKIMKMESDLKEFYSSRDEDSKISLSVQRDDYGQSTLGTNARYSINPNGFF